MIVVVVWYSPNVAPSDGIPLAYWEIKFEESDAWLNEAAVRKSFTFVVEVVWKAFKSNEGVGFEDVVWKALTLKFWASVVDVVPKAFKSNEGVVVTFWAVVSTFVVVVEVWKALILKFWAVSKVDDVLTVLYICCVCCL